MHSICIFSALVSHIVILIPVYNDAESLSQLLNELDRTIGQSASSRYTCFIVNDGSVAPLQLVKPSFAELKVLHLQRNIGHQKAIAIGMAYIRENLPCDKLLIMDSDGEDQPTDVPRLIKASEENPSSIIFARRGARQEGRGFRIFYKLYKFTFRLLTGKVIDFGNFMIIPAPLLEKAVYYSEIWNHIAAGIVKTSLPYQTISADRGRRYAGHSKMNFSSLLLHGFGAIAVFIENIASRLLILSLVLITISVITILILVGIRTFTDFAIPGWTSTVASAMLIILLQSFLLSLFTMFLYLSSQSQRKFIPAHHYKDYTGESETVA